MTEYCCKVFEKMVENPESVYDRDTTFEINDGEWRTNFSDYEYGDIRLNFCPFCGSKLPKIKNVQETQN